MLEIRYIQNTGVITALAGSPDFTGGHLEPKPGEQIVVLDMPNPEKPLEAFLFDEGIHSLIPNPDYIPPPEDYDTTPDYLRACEILSQSPPAMTMIEVWELLRIIGKRLGYRFEE